MESASFDHRVGLFRSEQHIHDDVVVILIDEESLEFMTGELGRWPWPRAAYRDLLEFFALAGAQAFAFDILFSERQVAGEISHDDRTLIDATRQAGNTVHAMQLLDSTQTGKKRPLPEDFERLFAIESDKFTGPYYDDYLLPFDALYQASNGIGFLEIKPDRDGVYRRVRLFNQFADNQVYPSLASALVLPLVGGKNRIEYDQEYTRIGELQIPLDGDGNFLINPYGRVVAYSSAQVFTAMQQIRAGASEDLVLDPGLFTGKLVLLGASAIGLHDVKTTALASKEAGVFLHAYTVSNILQQDFLRVQSVAASIAIIFLLCCISVIPITVMSRFRTASLFPLTGALLYPVIAYGAFASNQVYPVIAPVFAIALSLLLSYSLRTYYVNHSNQEIQGMPGQGAAANSPNAPIDNYSDVHAVAASQQTLSVLYLGIRDFSKISETLQPGQIVELLNIYYSKMTEVVLAHNGTLDKYTGDSILAYWGASIGTLDHAEQALTCALDMRKKLHLVNEKLINIGLPDLKIGIGIDSGSLVIGNLGSNKKLDYTIIGDSVNLAKHIEKLTKTYGCPVIMSENTCEPIRSAVPCVPIDMVKIKQTQPPVGLFAPAELFRLENRLSISTRVLQQQLERAFSLFLRRDWQDAAKTYAQIGHCALTELFQQRCRQCLSEQPGQEWDDVYTLAGK